MSTVTFHGGKKYYHDEYTTAAKRKALPEKVKAIIEKSEKATKVEQ